MRDTLPGCNSSRVAVGNDEPMVCPGVGPGRNRHPEETINTAIIATRRCRPLVAMPCAPRRSPDETRWSRHPRARTSETVVGSKSAYTKPPCTPGLVPFHFLSTAVACRISDQGSPVLQYSQLANRFHGQLPRFGGLGSNSCYLKTQSACHAVNAIISGHIHIDRAQSWLRGGNAICRYHLSYRSG